MATYPRLSIRADQELLDRVDRLAADLSQPGADLTRSDASRIALLRGLDVIETERAAAGTKKGPAPASKPAAKKTARK